MIAAHDQQTIASEVKFSGKALQTGRYIDMVCKPAPEDTGIVFQRTDVKENNTLRLKDLVVSSGEKRRSTIGMGPVQVQTVEHFLAALWALGIDNLSVEISGAELPAMDGSALGFLVPLKSAGLTRQNKPRQVIKITEPISVGDGDRTLSIVPDEAFSVSYLIDYKVACIGKEVFEIKLDQASFEKEIAPARTFCMLKEALFLFMTGLGRGATLKNTLVLGNRGPIGTEVKFPNEPVRHKILDLVGDMYMLGMPVIGKVKAERSGHKLNGMLLKKIYDKYVRA